MFIEACNQIRRVALTCVTLDEVEIGWVHDTGRELALLANELDNQIALDVSRCPVVHYKGNTDD